MHPVKVTPAGVHDQQEMEALLHGEEKALFGDKGYFSDQDQRAARKTGTLLGRVELGQELESQAATQK